MPNINKNRDKKKKLPDFRKWANKYLKPGSMAPVLGGWGEGKVFYCPTCDAKCNRSYYKDKWYCVDCDSPVIKMTREELQQMRKNAENTDKND